MPKLHVVRHEVTQPLDQSYRLIPLTQGQNAIVDVEDFEWLSQWNWYAKFDSDTQSFYAVRSINRKDERKMVAMQNAITGYEHTDHKNRNGLDNRRGNLRKATSIQNSMNRGKQRNNKSGFKGVCQEGLKKWRAEIKINGKSVRIGLFDLKEDAARAYDTVAHKLYGEFAFRNFPEVL